MFNEACLNPHGPREQQSPLPGVQRCRPGFSCCLNAAWTCTPVHWLPGDSEEEGHEESEAKHEVGRERRRETGRTYGCGEMPLAHSLELPHPAFQRLYTCWCLSPDCAHRSRHTFYLDMSFIQDDTALFSFSYNHGLLVTPLQLNPIIHFSLAKHCTCA